MGRVRAFVEDDIAEVSELHRRVFRTSAESSPEIRESYRRYFSELFLANPWVDASLPSLVYQDADGKVIAFLGVMPRRMSLNGRPVRVAVSSQFIVEPSRRFTLASVALVRAFLAGPQDLALADEASHAARRLWEALGGATALLHGLHWARILRPSRFLLSRLQRRNRLGAMASALTPLCRLVDGIAIRLPGSPCRQSPPVAAGEPLDPETLLTCLSGGAAGPGLRPEYDAPSLGWLLDILARKTGCGTFQSIAVRNPRGEIAGWYLYYLNPGGIGEVLQVGARPGLIKEVLDHLFYHAWHQGGAALCGHLEPRLIREFSEKGCFFHHRGYWTLAHAKAPELLQTVLRGDAVLTRLEGEWCMRFQGGHAWIPGQQGVVLPSDAASGLAAAAPVFCRLASEVPSSPSPVS